MKPSPIRPSGGEGRRPPPTPGWNDSGGSKRGHLPVPVTPGSSLRRVMGPTGACGAEGTWGRARAEHFAATGCGARGAGRGGGRVWRLRPRLGALWCAAGTLVPHSPPGWREDPARALRADGGRLSVALRPPCWFWRTATSLTPLVPTHEASPPGPSTVSCTAWWAAASDNVHRGLTATAPGTVRLAVT